MRWISVFAAGCLCAVLAFRVVAAERPNQAKVDSASRTSDRWVGVKVLPRTATAAFGMPDEAKWRASDISPWPQTVRKVNGNWLWIEAPQAHGWINARDVVPLSDAISFFSQQLAGGQTAWGLYMRGSAFREQERFAETYRDFWALETLEDQQVKKLMTQADAQMKQGSYAAVIATANQMARLRPRNAYVYTSRGAAYLMLNDVDQAKADYDHAVELASSTNVYAYRAHFYRRQKDYPLAIDDLTRAIRHFPYRWLYEQRAACLTEMGEYSRAIEDLNVVVAHESNKAEHYVQRGCAHLATGANHQAEADFSTAIRLTPTAETHRQIAESRLHCQQYEQAVEAASLAIQLNPKLTGAYVARGQAHARLNQDAKALADFNQALRQKPWGDAEAYMQRSQLYWKQHEVAKSLADAKSAAQLGDRSEACWLLQALGHLAKGETNEAIVRLDRIVTRYPNLREAFVLRSVAHWISGDEEQAFADWDESRRHAKSSQMPDMSVLKQVADLTDCPVELRLAWQEEFSLELSKPGG
jgi:tetratricopeptide (TPR) repeat protein